MGAVAIALVGRFPSLYWRGRRKPGPPFSTLLCRTIRRANYVATAQTSQREQILLDYERNSHACRRLPHQPASSSQGRRKNHDEICGHQVCARHRQPRSGCRYVTQHAANRRRPVVKFQRDNMIFASRGLFRCATAAREKRCELMRHHRHGPDDGIPCSFACHHHFNTVTTLPFDELHAESAVEVPHNAAHNPSNSQNGSNIGYGISRYRSAGN